MSDVRINTRSPYYIEANPTEPIQPVIPPPVGDEPPEVYITVSNDNPYLGEVATLTAVATDPDGTIVSYEWGGFGSGTTESITATNTALIQDQVFMVTVTDNDGNTATALATVSWKEKPEPVVNQDTNVYCGDVINEASFVGTKTYNLVGVEDKIGEVEIEFLDPGNNRDAPVKFDITWNGTTNTTGFIGNPNFSAPYPIPAPDNTTSPTNKKQPTTLTINKTAATPNEVVLTAESLSRNDNYSFRLNCPDVESPETFYYTITGTCTTGDTTFTYTDVNGDSQSIVLANGETELISAQENTVSAAICTGETEKGGQSFELGQPELTIDENAEFLVWLDSSGSLDDEVISLKEMTDNQLKDTFLTYYGNDSVKYNGQVQYITDPSFLTGTASYEERFFGWASVEKQSTSSDKIVHLIYVDEAYPSYTRNYLSDPNDKTQEYLDDIASLRSQLNAVTNYGDHIVIVFCIEKDRNEMFKHFSHFLDNVSNGTNGFDGSNGLSDRSEVVFVRNVLAKQDSDYYHQITIDALTSLGFKI